MPEPGTLAVSARGLKKVYRLFAEEIVALKEIDLEIPGGQFVSIMGPSGAGKTTLLNLIGCLDGVTSGSMLVLGRDVCAASKKERRLLRLEKLGFVFQEFFLVRSLTAAENVELPLVFAGRTTASGRSVELLEKVGLGGRSGHLPPELSGGEMQRVAIARALANRPEILLADEPTGNLDTKNARAIYALFRALSREEGITVIAATHNVRLAYEADRVIHLREGVIEKDERLGAEEVSHGR
jgi:putative ABC transport system ATP-binding protein